MFLLQAQNHVNDDTVVVSTLPHPMSMFLLGMFFIITVVLFVLYIFMSKQIKEQKDEMKKLMEKMEQHVEHTGEKLMFISKKIDSRVDKALNRKGLRE